MEKTELIFEDFIDLDQCIDFSYFRNSLGNVRRLRRRLMGRK